MRRPTLHRDPEVLLAIATPLPGLLVLVAAAAGEHGTGTWRSGALLLLAGGAAFGVLVRRRALGHGAPPRRALLGAALPVLVGALACVVALVLPGLLVARENARLVAWTAPGGAEPELIGAGVAVSTERTAGEGRDGPVTVVGRDARDGRVRWRTRVTDPGQARGARPTWQRVGRTALVTGHVLGFAAVDLPTGRLLWRVRDRGVRFSSVATVRTVASSHCLPQTRRGRGLPVPSCTAEGRDLRTGRVRWSVPVAPEGITLGSPVASRQERSGPLWPSAWAVTVQRDPGARPAAGLAARWPASHEPSRSPLRYAVRDVDTGRVALRGRADDEVLLAVAGSGLLRAIQPRSAAGAPTRLELQDPSTGRTRWSRELPSRVLRGDGPGPWLAMLSGWVPLSSSPSTPLTGINPQGPGRLRLRFGVLDPRTGRLVALPVPRLRHLSVPPAPDPVVDARTVAEVAPDPVVVVTSQWNNVVLALRPGDPRASRSWQDEGGGTFGLVRTARVSASVQPFELRDLSGARARGGFEVRDLRTGRRLGAVRSASAAQPKAVGDGIVFLDRDGDDDVVRVLEAAP